VSYVAFLLSVCWSAAIFCFSFSTTTARSEIYTLSLHDALPISRSLRRCLSASPGGNFSRAKVLPRHVPRRSQRRGTWRGRTFARDRKSTRLNSSHVKISYAVFCLKKKKHIKNKPINYHDTRDHI